MTLNALYSPNTNCNLKAKQSAKKTRVDIFKVNGSQMYILKENKPHRINCTPTTKVVIFLQRTRKKKKLA